MKILYLTVPSFFDLDISLIRELSRYCEVTVMLIVSPESMKASAFSVDKLLPHPQIICANEFPGVQKYKHLIDLNQWYIANNTVNSLKSGLILANQLKKFIRNGDYDLIHSTTNCKTTMFLMPFLWTFPNLLYTVHDPTPHHRVSKFYELVRRQLYFYVFKNLLFLSPSLTDKFVKKYKSSRLRIYFSKLGPYDFLKTYAPINKGYGKYILFFGRLAYYKGVDLLVQAFPKSEFFKDGYKLIIAGKGDLGVDKSSINSSIVVLNRYIENNELASLIRNSQAVVLPYRTATQSGCVMSAFAFNKPVLVTNVGDFPFAVDNNKSGIIVPCTVKSIITGLNKLYESDFDSMSEYIKSQYGEGGERSWNHIAKELTDVYSSIINN